MRELIITNGDSAGDCLKEADPNATVLAWRDVLHEGPVPMTATVGELSDIRAQYIKHQWDVDAGHDFQQRDHVLNDLSGFERISLWFEHDLYDQLQLIQILDGLSKTPRQGLALVQADDYLSHYGPDDMAAWREQSEPVSQAQIDLAVRAWAAFRQNTPLQWAALLDDDLTPLPFLQAAVVRMFEELPAVGSGVSRTERHILEMLDQGHTRPGHIFRAYLACEEAKFLGDWGFFDRLDGLAQAKTPLITLDGDIRFRANITQGALQDYLNANHHITDFGRAVLVGTQDHAAHNIIDFWWGGTNVKNDNLWRWDCAAQALVMPR